MLISPQPRRVQFRAGLSHFFSFNSTENERDPLYRKLETVAFVKIDSLLDGKGIAYKCGGGRLKVIWASPMQGTVVYNKFRGLKEAVVGRKGETQNENDGLHLVENIGDEDGASNEDTDKHIYRE